MRPEEEHSVEFVGDIFGAIIRNVLSICVTDNSTNSNAVTNYEKDVYGGLTNYNEASPGTRQRYATVDGSSVVLDHTGGSTNFGMFQPGKTYEYLFVKITT